VSLQKSSPFLSSSSSSIGGGEVASILRTGVQIDFCPEGPARNASRSDAGGDYRAQPGVSMKPNLSRPRCKKVFS
jgi:hypothetical protein